VLWSTRKENGFFTVETTELVAFSRMLSAPFRPECSLRPRGQLATPLWVPLEFCAVIGAILGGALLNDLEGHHSVLLSPQPHRVHRFTVGPEV